MSSTETSTTSAATATFEDLTSKPRRELTFPITIADAEGNPIQRELAYRAIPSREYDDLLAKHPPTAKQREEGSAFNVDTFAPALISAVSLRPELSLEQVEKIWHDPAWSQGELSTLFWNAQRVCNTGLDVPFNARG